MKKIVGSTLVLSENELFLIGQVTIKTIWVENTVFAIQHVGNKKKFY